MPPARSLSRIQTIAEHDEIKVSSNAAIAASVAVKLAPTSSALAISTVSILMSRSLRSLYSPPVPGRDPSPAEVSVAPRALVVVRNTVTHDARVLRAAVTLRQLGYRVLICGVVSTGERQTELVLEGVPVVRLDPAGALRRLRRFKAERFAAHPRSPPAPSGRDRSRAGSAVGDGETRDDMRWRRRVNRVGLAISFYVQGARLVRRCSPSLVHANDYNTMWIGIAAKLLCGSRLVYDSHELWPDRNGRPEWRPWLLLCEALFVRVADVTVTASPGYAWAIARRYRVPAPLVVRNIPAHAADRGADCRHRSDRGPLAIYVGGLMPGRGIEQTIDALTRLDDLRLRLVGPGHGAYVAQLRRRVATAGLQERVEFRAAVPPSKVLAVLADGDIGLMLIQPICRSYELTLPNKLFEYATAGLPILASDLPVIGPLIREADIGAVAPPDDIERIAEALARLSTPAESARLRRRVAAYAQRETWEQEQGILADAYRGILGREPRAGEPRRVAGVYARYGTSPRKRRSWDSANPGNAAIRAELADAAFALAGSELAAAGDILDVGCGSGWWLEHLTNLGATSASLHGLELLPDRVAAAQRRVPGAQLQIGDARGLPYEPASFDVVTLFTVLSSTATLRDAERALSEARRVLRPGGVVLVWEPRIRNPLNPHVQFIPRSLLAGCLPAGTDTRLTTVAPAVARRLGRRTERVYPRLAAIEPLLTHRLSCGREP